MAIAPDWTQDEKKRRSGLARRADVEADRFRRAGLFGEGGTAQGAFEDTVASLDPVDEYLVRRPQQAVRQLFFGEQTAPAAAQAAQAVAATTAAAPPKGARRSQFAGKVFDSRTDLSPTNLRGAGLQRVVKTADGTYTDDPNATGDVRYYNAFGNRADVRDVAKVRPGLSPQDAVAAHLANENAAALDLSNPANARAVLENGREAQRQMAERQQQLATRQEAEFLASLSPEDRTKLTTERIKESGLDRRAAAQVAATTRGQDIALQAQRAGLINATGTQAQRQFDNELKLSDRLNNPETRQAEVNRILAPLRGLSRAERVQVLSDPNNTPVQAAIAALELETQQQNRPFLGMFGGVGSGFDFGDLEDTGWAPGVLGGKRYSDQRTAVGGYVDPGDANPYLDDELIRDLIAARRTQSLRARGR